VENSLKIELENLASRYHLKFKINDDKILFFNKHYNINLKLLNENVNIFHEWKRGLLGQFFFKEEYNRLINLKKDIIVLLEQNNYTIDEIIRNTV